MNSQITYLNPKPVQIAQPQPQQPQYIVVQAPPGCLQRQQGGCILQYTPAFVDRRGRNPVLGLSVMAGGFAGLLFFGIVMTKLVFAIFPPAVPVASPCTRGLISASTANAPLPPPVTPQLGVQVPITETGYQATFPTNSVWSEYGGTQYFGEPAQIQRVVTAWDKLKALPGYEARLAKTKRIWLGQGVTDMAGNGFAGGGVMGGSVIMADPYGSDDDQLVILLDHENRHNNGEGHGTINGESLQLADTLGISRNKITYAP